MNKKRGKFDHIIIENTGMGIPFGPLITKTSVRYTIRLIVEQCYLLFLV